MFPGISALQPRCSYAASAAFIYAEPRAKGPAASPGEAYLAVAMNFAMAFIRGFCSVVT